MSVRLAVNRYRSKLNPSDPEYEDLMESEEDDCEPPFDDGEIWDGPYHYVPPGDW